MCAGVLYGDDDRLPYSLNPKSESLNRKTQVEIVPSEVATEHPIITGVFAPPKDGLCCVLICCSLLGAQRAQGASLASRHVILSPGGVRTAESDPQ